MAFKAQDIAPTIGLGALGLLSIGPAFGQGAAPAEENAGSGAIPLPTVNVTGGGLPANRGDDRLAPRLPTSVHDTPQSIDVIPRALIEERGAVSLREALRNVTGISLAAGEGGLSGDNLTLRGFSASNDFYIDGIRDAANYTRDPFNVDSIEVLKGPSSILFGRGSTGGVINQTTRLPQARNFGEVTGSVFAPLGGRGTLDVNMRIDQVAVRLNAMGMVQQTAGRDHVQNSRFGVAPSVTWGLGGPTQFTLSYLHQEENNTPDFGVPFVNGRPAPVARGSFYGLNGVDRERYTTDVITGILQHQFDRGLTLRNVTRYGSYYRDIDATAPRLVGTVTPLTPLGSILVNRQAQIRSGVSTILENHTELRANFTTGPLEHSLVSGIEVGRETAQLRRWTATRPTASLLTPDFNQGIGFTERRSLTADTLVNANRLAAFAVDQIRIGRYFEILGGVRFDRFASDFQNRITAGQNSTRTDDMVSWRGALVFKPTETIRAYFAAGTSFNPSVESLVLAVANTNLAPERNRSMEVGASWDITPNLILRGAIFRIEKTNARTVDPTNASVNVLAGNQRVEGFEASIAGAIMPGWNVIAGYTYLDSRIEKSNNPAEVGRQLLNTPRHTATVWTTYDLPGNVTIGGGASYIDTRYGNNTNTVRVPAYTRFDAALSWRMTETVTARFNILNITDKRFYEGVYAGNTTPGAGRTFLMSVAARF